MAKISLALISQKGELDSYDNRGDENLSPAELAEKKAKFDERIKQQMKEGRFDSVYRIGEYGEDKVMVHLPENRTYRLALDASSTCTGIYITDSEHSFHFIADMQRTFENKHRFYENLRGFLRTLLKNCEVELFVMEDLPPIKYRGAGNVLREMRGIIESWQETDAMFKRVPKMQFIPPQTWKSRIIDKSKGKNRFNIKIELAKDLVDRFPELDWFFRKCISKDFDSFDACGIYYGYQAVHFTEEGHQKIGGSKSFHGDVLVFYRLLSAEELAVPENRIGPFLVLVKNHGGPVLQWNSEYSPIDNYKMAASKNPFSATIVNDLLTNIAVRWQFNLGINDKKLFAYVVQKRLVKGKYLEMLKSTLPYEEILN